MKICVLQLCQADIRNWSRGLLDLVKLSCDKRSCLWYYESDNKTKMTFAETKVSLNDIYKYTSSNGLKGSFMDTERYEYKWAGSSNVNAVWTQK